METETQRDNNIKMGSMYQCFFERVEINIRIKNFRKFCKYYTLESVSIRRCVFKNRIPWKKLLKLHQIATAFDVYRLDD